MLLVDLGMNMYESLEFMNDKEYIACLRECAYAEASIVPVEPAVGR